MTRLIDLTIKEARESLAKKEFSATELVKAHLEQMHNTKDLNIYITTTPEMALENATIADEKIKNNEQRPLEGIPVAVKDLYCTYGVKTTSASKILHNFVPHYESHVTKRLFNSGAIMVGKANMDEFAMGSATMTGFYGTTVSPWKIKDQPDVKLTAGGSSGGSSAAISAKTAMAALGSDTGGSVRQPASYCGLFGVKPTYGRCSRWGMIAFASSLDQAGLFANNVTDGALVLEQIMGFDNHDSTSVNMKVPDLTALLNADIKGMRIGIPKEYLDNNLPEEITKMWTLGAKLLEERGAEIKEISLPHTKYSLPVYYIIAPAEASSNLARYDGVRYGHRTKEEVSSLDEMYALTRGEGFNQEVKRRILTGTYVLSSKHFDSYFIKAQSVRTLIIQDFKEAFKQVDCILTPSTPSAAFALNQKFDDPVMMYLNDIFTIPASLAGLPCVSIPAGLNQQGLPLGLQLIANSFDEVNLFRASYALEKSVNFTANAGV
jgi:aspartyl-tRNA(Asn)/glutamyl-tRNA(Gln) amidotransferase subunit A